MIGEIGGSAEEEAAELLKKEKKKKTMIGYVKKMIRTIFQKFDFR